MSGILGEGLLGEILLGESESGTFAFGQAQAQIIAFDVSKHGQAQASILREYQGYAQAQSFIVYTQFSFAQAQAYVLGYGFGNTQGQILQTYQGYAQSQALIVQSYQGYAESQGWVLSKPKQYAQAQAYIGTRNTFGQAKADILQTYTKSAVAKARVKAPIQKYAQARAKVVYKTIQFAQSMALIKEQPVGQAAALIDSSIKNEVGQAQAYICWIDTYSRVEPYGLGTDYIWAGNDTSFSFAEDSTYHVDGSKVSDSAPGDFNYDDYILNRPASTFGTASFEFTTNSTLEDWPYIALILGEDYGGSIQEGGLLKGYGFINIAVYGNGPGEQWWLSPYWSYSWWTGSPIDNYGEEYSFTPLPDTTYRVKMVYDADGYMAAKIWNIADSEPNWQIAGQFLDTLYQFNSDTNLYEIIGTVPYRSLAPTDANNPLLDFYFSPDIIGFDNLEFCVPELFTRYDIIGTAQATALITNTVPPANAQASVVQTYNGFAQAGALLNTGFGFGIAQSTIAATNVAVGQTQALILQTLPFIDRFDNRYTVDPYVQGLGDPYLWPGNNVFIAGGTPLIKNVYVDGEKVIVKSDGFGASFNINKGDGYWLPIRYLPHNGFIQFDFNTGSGTRAENKPLFAISGTTTKGGMLDIGIRWNTFASGGPRWRLGAVNVGGTSNDIVLSDDTWYRIKLRWNSSGNTFWQIWNRDSGSEASLIASGGLAFSWTAVSYGTRTLVRLEFIGEESGDSFLVDNIVIGHQYPTGQARARIKLVNQQSYGQAQALINTRFGLAQAQARIETSYYGHAQSQAQVNLWLGVGQAQAVIGQNVFYESAQAQAFLNLRLGVAQAQAQIGMTWRFAQSQAMIGMTWRMGQAQAMIGQTFGIAQAQATLFATRRVNGNARARIKIKRWVFAQAQAFIKGRFGFGNAKAQINRPNVSRVAQAQAYIGSFKTGQAQAQIKVEGAYYGAGQSQAVAGLWIKPAQTQARIKQIGQGYGQALGLIQGFKLRHAQSRALIQEFKIRPAQARAKIIYSPFGFGQAVALVKSLGQLNYAQAQASIVGYTNRLGQAQAFIKRIIEFSQAQAFIEQNRAGKLVRFNGLLVPGYLQEESFNNTMRINIQGVIYGETYQEYNGLENKMLSLRMKIAESTYAAAKEKYFLAGTILRSGKEEWTKLTVIDPTKYYMAKTVSIKSSQVAGINEKHLDYEIQFECKPWKFGEYHSLNGITTLDTNSVGRNFDSGSWTPATIIVTGNNITISGHTPAGDFTGFVSIQGPVNNFSVDTENYISDNESLMNYDYKLLVAPGRTLFDITGATSCEIIYQDRWEL